MRRGTLGLASLAAMFSALGQAVRPVHEGIERATEVMRTTPFIGLDRAPIWRKKRSKRGWRAHLKPTDNTTYEYMRRQNNRRRWLEGMYVKDEDRLPLEAAQRERERKGAKRAYAARRQVESQKLNAECAAYYAQVDAWSKDHPNPSYEQRMDACDALGWPRIKQLLQLWDDKMPLEIVFGATAA